MSKACDQDKIEDPSAMTITCGNCGEEGHRLRDCKAERQKRGGAKDCRRCGESKPSSTLSLFECLLSPLAGHISKECPNNEGGGGGGRACHNCGNEDHISKDCPEPRKQICRNCNEEGHMSKECEKPKNPANVTCRNCEQGESTTALSLSLLTSCQWDTSRKNVQNPRTGQRSNAPNVARVSLVVCSMTTQSLILLQWATLLRVARTHLLKTTPEIVAWHQEAVAVMTSEAALRPSTRMGGEVA